MNKKTTSYIINQISQVRGGGLRVLFKKLRAIPMILLAFPVVFFVRMLRPFVIVRFGVLPSDRIGHFAVDVELYLNERDAGIHGPRNFDIFYYNATISNYQLKKMWDRTLRVYSFAKWMDIVNRILPAGGVHEVPLSSVRDPHGLFTRLPSHLSFTEEEERLGRKELERIGISKGNPFVCFHARDDAYLNNLRPNSNWHYHDYRDCNIYNYIIAVEELTRRGYSAIRMGKIIKEALDTSNTKIIDYATNSRSDFLDIYLSAKCRFFIGCGSGVDAVAVIFRKPVVYVNFIPLETIKDICAVDSLVIPKKLWLKEEKRFLTFRETLSCGVGSFLHGEQYQQRGIEVIENTSEEINDLVAEMDERLEGTWQATEEDEELQRHSRSFFRSSELNQIFLPRIGAKFLRQNQQLLSGCDYPVAKKSKLAQE